MTTTQRDKAVKFNQLHRGKLLVLPNVWDVASTLIVAQAGFPAIATGSAGVAATLGYPDGQRISRDEMANMVAKIARAVDLPVTADMEAGYGLRRGDVAETVRAVIDAGAVGFNLEDVAGDEGGVTLFEMAEQVERIRTARATAESLGVPIVINARTDVYLGQVGQPEDRLADSTARLKAYRAAGADCLFLPGVVDLRVIRTVVDAVAAPVNVLATQGTPPLAELERTGVARVSVGSGLARSALGHARRMVEELRDRGTYGFLQGAIPYAEVNRMLAESQAKGRA